MPAFRVRAVVFDAVGTLIAARPDVVGVYCRFGRKHGSLRRPDEVARLFAGALRATPRTLEAEAGPTSPLHSTGPHAPGREGRWSGPPSAFQPVSRAAAPEPYATSEAAERQFWRDVVAAVLNDLAEPDAAACFEELFEYFGRPEAWRAYDDVAAALRGLSEAGFELAVASNFDARLHTVFAGLPELAPLGRRFVSSEIGWRKPDRRFFEAVCEGLGRPPGEVLYVGDEPETDVAAAVAAGMQAVHLTRGEPLVPGRINSLSDLAGLLRPTQAGNSA